MKFAILIASFAFAGPPISKPLKKQSPSPFCAMSTVSASEKDRLHCPRPVVNPKKK